MDKVTCGPSKAPQRIPSNFQVVYGGTISSGSVGMPNAMVSYAPLSAYYAPGAPVGLYEASSPSFVMLQSPSIMTTHSRIRCDGWPIQTRRGSVEQV